jgi:hypothetical protein
MHRTGIASISFKRLSIAFAIVLAANSQPTLPRPRIQSTRGSPNRWRNRLVPVRGMSSRPILRSTSSIAIPPAPSAVAGSCFSEPLPGTRGSGHG